MKRMGLHFRWKGEPARWRRSPPTWRLLWWLLSSCVLLGGCSQRNPAQDTHTPTYIPLTPYLTRTPSSTPAPPHLPSATPQVVLPSPTPTITPTPHTYKIASGDTLGGVALRFGISLPALQTANPKVDPRLLSVGATLVIPAQPPGTPSPEPLALVTSTPQPLLVQAPVCYPSADGRLTCLVTVENDQDATLENITAWVGLANAQGESISSQVAIPPLNILTSGEKLPLVAIFSPSAEAASPQVRLLSAVPVPAGDQRYARTRLDIQKEIIDPGKLQATLSGEVELLPPRKPAKQASTATPQSGASGTVQPEPVAHHVWLAAVAYGPGGAPVGYRKWEAELDLYAGSKLPFEVTVYSLGPAIEKVELLVEAGL